MTPKQAHAFGLIADDAPTATVQPQHLAAPQPARRASYTSQGLLGWQFATAGADCATIYAFRCLRSGGVEHTARLAAGDGDDLGSHYRPAAEAIARGEYTTEGR